MWYVEAMIGDKHERWEGLTKDQAKWVYDNYVDQEIGLVRKGIMNAS